MNSATSTHYITYGNDMKNIEDELQMTVFLLNHSNVCNKGSMTYDRSPINFEHLLLLDGRQ